MVEGHGTESFNLTRLEGLLGSLAFAPVGGLEVRKCVSKSDMEGLLHLPLVGCNDIGESPWGAGRSALGQDRLTGFDTVSKLGVDLIKVSDQVVRCGSLVMSSLVRSLATMDNRCNNGTERVFR